MQSAVQGTGRVGGVTVAAAIHDKTAHGHGWMVTDGCPRSAWRHVLGVPLSRDMTERLPEHTATAGRVQIADAVGDCKIRGPHAGW